MKFAQKNKSGWLVYDTDLETNAAPSAALEALLDTEFNAKLSSVKDEEGFVLGTADFYNVDDTNEDTLTYSSGVANFLVNGVRNEPLNFKS